MFPGPRLDELARLVGDPSRAAILSALMDGRAWTGRELAIAAHVTPSTASTHLQRLVEGDLLTAVSQGRHRYYSLASPRVAQTLEALLLLAPHQAPRHARGHAIDAELRAARTCYDHLAGRLGVAVADALLTAGAITFFDGAGALTTSGTTLFNEIGITLQCETGRRLLCRPCLDWSERRPHLGGLAGALLARHALDAGWVRRKEGTRALLVTAGGIEALDRFFHVRWREIDPA